jgi:hypothetical protein
MLSTKGEYQKRKNCKNEGLCHVYAMLSVPRKRISKLDLGLCTAPTAFLRVSTSMLEETFFANIISGWVEHCAHSIWAGPNMSPSDGILLTNIARD